ncbi:Ras-associating (RA) domain [Trinorchestia longiramus]|nr:Ras-associating (RA) domain [Trinorchestia longiramus]
MSATEVEIGVWVDGSQKWVSGVTRRTTCYDLIRALLRAQNLRATDADVMNYIIVERWKKVERPLDHEQRILKVWKSWGDTVHQVRFSLRRGRDESPDADDNPKKKNKQSCGQDWDKNKENDAQLDGSGSQDGAESSCGRSERSRRRHKMRQSRREATACLHKANVQRVPPLQRHRPGVDSPQPLSDDSDSRDCGTKKTTKQEPKKPPRDDPRYKLVNHDPPAFVLLLLLLLLLEAYQSHHALVQLKASPSLTCGHFGASAVRRRKGRVAVKASHSQASGHGHF